METIKKFEEMLETNENLALEYQKLVVDKDSEAVVNFMKTHGVSDEVSDEVSDDDLDGVSGGMTNYSYISNKTKKEIAKGGDIKF
ncbi:MAG: hypothetical protein U9O56_10455 [Campylobacterota bacterium]|nr:hypothetical protein [Campylobacterota bacterium]